MKYIVYGGNPQTAYGRRSDDEDTRGRPHDIV